MFLRSGRCFFKASRFCGKLFHTNGRTLCPIKVGMPSLSPTMDSGTIVAWHKNEGDEVTPGDLLCEVQTDKAVVGMEVDEEGILAKIIQPQGSVNKVGDLIALIANSDEDWKEVNSSADSIAASSGGDAAPAGAPAPPESTATVPVAQEVGKQLPIGPAVRLLMSSYGITPGQISGSGPHGTILKGDVLTYIETKGLQKVAQTVTPVSGVSSTSAAQSAGSTRPAISGPGYTDIPVSSMRATIAKRLLESKATIPHAYTAATMTVDHLFALNKAVNKAKLVDTKISVNDLIIKACAYALRLVPDLNGHGHGFTFKRSSDVDICVAVSTPAGLITPVVRMADRLPISSISSQVKEMALRARENKLKPEEFTGGTFTISNLGMFGVREFSAIINPPQVAILAVGSGQPAMRETSTGDLEATTSLTLTLSIDARFVDEVTAAAFLRHVQRYLESDPEALYADDPVLASAAGCSDLSLMAL